MKHLYLALIFLILAVKTTAQVVITPKGTRVFIDSSKWILSGDNILNKNSGKIGIGTASPTAKLHVNGELRLEGLGTSTSNTRLLTTDSSGNVTTRDLSYLFSGTAAQLMVDARKTGTYSTTVAYTALIYNTASINVGSVYNTSNGLFTAPATGLYEIIVNNCYSWGNSSCAIANQIVVDGTIDMEKSITSSSNSTNSVATISGNTVVSLTAGQTVSITVGGLIGSVTPRVGTGQHVLKILKLQ